MIDPTKFHTYKPQKLRTFHTFPHVIIVEEINKRVVEPTNMTNMEVVNKGAVEQLHLTLMEEVNNGMEEPLTLTIVVGSMLGWRIYQRRWSQWH